MQVPPTEEERVQAGRLAEVQRHLPPYVPPLYDLEAVFAEVINAQQEADQGFAALVRSET